jgi:hypothetical protein
MHPPAANTTRSLSVLRVEGDNILWLIPLSLILFILILYGVVAASTLGTHYVCLGFVLWMYLEVNWKLARSGAELL